MPLFSLPRLALATRVTDAVREIRRQPADDRTKKEMLNQWFNEQDLMRRSQQGGLRPGQVARALLGGVFGRGPGVVDRLRAFERTNFEASQPLSRQQKRQAFDELFGPHRNSRLRG